MVALFAQSRGVVGYCWSIDDAKHWSRSRRLGASAGPLPSGAHQNSRSEFLHVQTQRHLLGFSMIVRGLIRAQVPKIASRRVFRMPMRPMRTARRYSTSNPPSMASSTAQSQASMLATITTDLDKIAPRFEVQPDQITIIQTPTEFYEILKVGFISLRH
jgi:hypothetical protein